MKSKSKSNDSPASNIESEPLAKESASLAFPIVGVGASAGGLEALEEFLRHVPDKSGLAFVIVQHLDPTHKGLLPELLQRAIDSAVRLVRETRPAEPGAGTEKGGAK